MANAYGCMIGKESNRLLHPDYIQQHMQQQQQIIKEELLSET